MGEKKIEIKNNFLTKIFQTKNKYYEMDLNYLNDQEFDLMSLPDGSPYSQGIQVMDYSDYSCPPSVSQVEIKRERASPVSSNPYPRRRPGRLQLNLMNLSMRLNMKGACEGVNVTVWPPLDVVREDLKKFQLLKTKLKISKLVNKNWPRKIKLYRKSFDDFGFKFKSNQENQLRRLNQNRSNISTPHHHATKTL